MSKVTTVLILNVLAGGLIIAQTSDNQYRRPLKDVLEDIQIRYHITIKYEEAMVADKWITYADWCFRPDVEKTLTNVLTPMDLIFRKEEEGKYKIKHFEYARIPVEEGREILDSLSTLYHDIASWEKRKTELRTCMWDALKLDPLPDKPGSQPIITAKRKMDGYTIENIALETLPGLFVCGSIYKPAKPKGKMPVVLCPNGHFKEGRYYKDIQIQCAMLAKMGAIVMNYDLFAWGESGLQFKSEDHRRSLAMTIQALNSIRILDYLTSLPEADTGKVGITGASGGGSQTMLITALDDRIKVSVPVVMLSCYFYGGCPCESGMPVHLCGGGTNNVELAAMAAPRPLLVISDGKDWSDHVPEIEYPYLQKIYSYYNAKELVRNVHFAEEGHDYGLSKRFAMYNFIAQHLGLNSNTIQNKNGVIDESKVTVEEESAMHVFGKEGELLPSHAIKSFEELEKVFENSSR